MPISPPARTPAPASELPDDRYLNRELSWLDFNARVLALAEDPSQPLLERAKFLAIFASNLDEFYMVRVAGLKRRDETGLAVRSADGLSPREQLARIATRSQAIAEAHARVFLEQVRPELEEQGIRILRWSDLVRRPARQALGVLPRPGLPGAHPARRRPRPPVPLHLRALAQPRGHRARSGRPHRAVRPGEGAQQRAAPGERGHRRARGGLPARRGPHRRAPGRAVHGHGGRRGARVPRHPQRRRRGRGGPRRGPPAVARTRAGPPPVRARRCASRSPTR